LASANSCYTLFWTSRSSEQPLQSEGQIKFAVFQEGRQACVRTAVVRTLQCITVSITAFLTHGKQKSQQQKWNQQKFPVC
jgi:hypothetical protein